MYTSKILSAVDRLSGMFFHNMSTKTLIGKCLDELLSITGSECGNIAKITFEKEKQSIQLLAISSNACTLKAVKLDELTKSSAMDLYNLDALLDEVMKSGMPVTPKTSSADITQGQTGLKTYLGLPFSFDGQIIGMCSLANAEHYNSTLIAEIQPVINLISNIIFAKSIHRKSKLLEEQASMKESYINEVFQKSSDALVIVKANGLIDYVNESMCNMFAYQQEELTSRDIQTLLYPSVEAKENTIISLLQNHVDIDIIEVQGKTKAANLFPVELSVTQFTNNSVTFYTIILRNISLHKDYLNKIEEARLAAEASDMAKSNFLMIMSHELRTPLHAIISSLQLVQDMNEKGGIAEQMNDIAYSAAQELLGSLNGILEYIQLEKGHEGKNDSYFSINDLLRTTFEAHTSAAKNKGLDYLLESPILQDRHYHGDPFKIKQIISNLINNAIKFTHKGFVKLSVKISIISPKVDDITICIEDSGIGIEDSKQQEIFKFFYQADGSITRRYEGFGMGLSYAKKASNILHGKIRLTSTLEKGSCFSLCVPLRKTIIPSDQDTDSHALCRILVVEDNKTNTIYLQALLTKYHCHVDTATNGLFALELYKKNKYDLILMDLMMPKMDGYECTHKIRALDKSIPIIAVSANYTEAHVHKCIDYGMNEFIAKPIDADKLIRKIEEHLAIKLCKENKS
ncbi:MAG: response regulator [Lentisphaeraceae bacterium]|nr:response regulator [Lentisphaeraceae bacterium]